MNKKMKMAATFIAVTYTALMLFALGIALCGCSCATTYPPKTSDSRTIRRVAESSVVVYSTYMTPKGPMSGIGSGTVVWARNGMSLVLTCRHVIIHDELGAAGIVRVEHNDEPLPAFVEDADASTDLALLLVLGNLGAPPLPIASRSPDLYERLFLIGTPDGIPGTVATGILTSKNRVFEDFPSALWQVTAFVWPGMSGGTVTNTAGELVAVPDRVHVATDGSTIVPEIGFVVPLPAIKKMLRSYQVGL